MRNRALFIGFLVLNAVFAAVLVVLVLRSGNQSSTPPPVELSSVTPVVSSNAPSAPPSVAAGGGTNQPVAASPAADTTPPQPVARPRVHGKSYGWQEMDSTNYLHYLDDLRSVGCPEKHIRQIVFEDANERFNQRR
ncbi:MAG: hypothetical protein FJ405_17195, partial [Verrucomicrobia bacterium]|nr:hypothetical protein [Verrucomicrobiota bacterium]